MAIDDLCVRQGKMSIEVKSCEAKLLALGALSGEEFDVLMDKAIASYSDGQCVSIDEFEASFKKE